VSTPAPNLLDVELRPYAALTGASAVAISFALAQRGDASFALIPLILATAGLLLKRTWAPGAVLGTTVYLLIFPFGMPTTLPRLYGPASGFALSDVIVIAAMLTYLLSQFRLFSLLVRAVPNEKANLAAKLHDPPIRRPYPTLTQDELFRLGGLIVLAVLAGQFLLLAAQRFEIRPLGGFPLRLAELGRRGDRLQHYAVPLLLLGLPALLLRFYFWVKKYRALSQDEARLLLLDTAWSENRRELARFETWRAWGRGQRPPGKFPWKFVLLLLLGVLLLGCGYTMLMFFVDALTGF
jgi:hypothetical protein